ncbi:MAG: AmmeMemoRadiSam system protein B [Promethearchaeota archaeon Loki_b32]|nr:MAG: AmmeMemoRadiSam system protein B [Candidatus Lokiarchaeota archaeon Loki_b32]
MVTRQAIVAGHFYPRYKPDLLKIIKDSFLDKEFGPGEEFKTLNKDERTIIGGVSPHAGYIYSGCAAAYTFLNLFKEKIPDTIIILGTDHIGYGKIALMSEGEWETPLGNISIDKELSERILDNSNKIINDESAFIGHPFGREHNIEVQLPFIKYCAQEKSVKFIPIKVAVKDFNVLSIISNDIAKSIESYDKDVVIVASSDMTHKEIYDTKQLVKFKERDQQVIEAFVNMNPEKTLETASKTTVCGSQTITSLLMICKNLNASKGKLLKYYTSSEKTGNISGYCVGYFSGVLMK